MERETVNCLIANGGIGDMICATTAIDYIIKNCPYIKLLIWVPNYMVDFFKNVLPEEARVRSYSEGKTKYNNKLTGITTTWDKRFSPMRVHPVDYAFNILTDRHIYDDSQKNYLKVKLDKINIKQFNLPEKYVVLQAYATERVKRLDGKILNSIADYVKEKGYEVVFVGRGEAHTGINDIKMKSIISPGIDLTKGIDLTNKTSLTELGKVIAQSKAFIGMDGGSLHVAGFTDVAIIAGFTLVSPDHILPIRNNQRGWNCFPVLPTNSCNFCQTKGILIFEKDFRDCIWDKNYECIKSLKFENFKEQIDKVL